MTLYFSLGLALYLTVGITVYWTFPAIRKKYCALFLSLFSLLGMGLIDPFLPILYAGFAGVIWYNGQILQNRDEGSGSLRLIFQILLVLVVWSYFRYAGQLLKVWMIEGDSLALLLPLGFSYFMFRSVQFLIDSYRGTISSYSFTEALAYFSFLPLLPAGPIETIQGFFSSENQKSSKEFDEGLFKEGVYRILLGYIKKVFLLSILFKPVFTPIRDAIFNLDQGLTAVGVLSFGPAMFTYAFLDLSAYSDIAIGVSRLFGFRIVENFEKPYAQLSLSDFWRSWHISLSSWCRNNIYFPVFGFTRNASLGLYLCMLTMGLWHHVNLNWTFWALYHGSGLVVMANWERKCRKNKAMKRLRKSNLWKLLGWVTTMCFVSFGYILVGTQTWEIGRRAVFQIWPIWLTFILIVLISQFMVFSVAQRQQKAEQADKSMRA